MMLKEAIVFALVPEINRSKKNGKQYLHVPKAHTTKLTFLRIKSTSII